MREENHRENKKIWDDQNMMRDLKSIYYFHAAKCLCFVCYEETKKKSTFFFFFCQEDSSQQVSLIESGTCRFN